MSIWQLGDDVHHLIIDQPVSKFQFGDSAKMQITWWPVSQSQILNRRLRGDGYDLGADQPISNFLISCLHDDVHDLVGNEPMSNFNLAALR